MPGLNPVALWISQFELHPEIFPDENITTPVAAYLRFLEEGCFLSTQLQLEIAELFLLMWLKKGISQRYQCGVCANWIQGYLD